MLTELNRTECLFIHPGFAKSGTTVIQNHIFGEHDQILSLGRPWTDLNVKIGKEIKGIEGINYDAVLVASLIEKALSGFDAFQNKCIVLSDETLCLNAYMRNTIATRLKALFQNAQIVFTIRNQIKALESFYGNHGRILKGVPEPFYGRFVSLENWLSYAFENKNITCLGLFDYHKTISMYEKIFGHDRVHVLLFEDFVSNKKEFCNNLTRLLSVDGEQAYSLVDGKWANPRDPASVVAYIRLREKILTGVSIRSIVPFGNNLQKWFSNYLKKGRGLKVVIPDNWKMRLNNFYKEGNVQLMKSKGLSLDKYGYPL